jgi:hypothetical protein
MFDDELDPEMSNVCLQLLLPSGYLYLEAIVKTARADGVTPIDVAIASPVQAAGPVDVTVWYRPTSWYTDV